MRFAGFLLALAVVGGAPTVARAANVLFVSDSMSDINIPAVLMGDGHTVTMVTGDFATGNATLRGSLAAYDVVVWSATGSGFGDSHTDPTVFSNLTTFVTGGGRVFVTGYDSIASPTDPMLISFLGGAGSSDVPPRPRAIIMTDTSLTTGVVDIRGVTPTGGWGDLDELLGPYTADLLIVCPGGGSGASWVLRTVGSGEIAYVSDGAPSGSTDPSWTATGAGGAGAYNAALRNFAAAAGGSMCTGEGTACTSGGGAAGICRGGRCCTGCWDGTRCQAGTTAIVCGDAGAMCRSCADGDLCTSDVCSATGTCSNPFAPAGTTCNDGVFCTRTDTCNGTGSCTGAGARCDDSEECTTDSCDEMADMCTNAPRPDLTACMTGGRAGVCRTARCCAGCWDGALCQVGTGAANCGAAGAMCARCIDGDLCTSDVCAAGVCSNPDAPLGTPCDDMMFCTTTDTCDGSGGCTGGGAARCNDMVSCTADSCDEMADRCVFTPVMGCTIGGSCIAEGSRNPTYPCQVCDPAMDPTDWSILPVGTMCGPSSCAGGRLTERQCDMAGICSTARSTCPTGACADTTTCEMSCTAGSCPDGMFCDGETMECQAELGGGAACDGAVECATGFCVDGTCCEAACDGVCERCDGAGGACRPVARGVDPDDECPAACDGAGACEGSDAGGGDGGGTDAGRDSGGGDAATGADSGRADAGAPPPGDGGCGCHAPGGRDRSGGVLLLLVVAVLGWAGRRGGRRRP